MEGEEIVGSSKMSYPTFVHSSPASAMHRPTIKKVGDTCRFTFHFISPEPL